MRFGDCLRTQGSVALAAGLDTAPVRNRYAAHRQSRSVHAVLGTSFFRPGVAHRPSEATGTRLGRGFATILACRTGVESSCWFAIEEALKLREAHGGEVTVLTMGPEQASESIRKAILWSSI